jgi:hypothetical protein
VVDFYLEQVVEKSLQFSWSRELTGSLPARQAQDALISRANPERI